MGMGFVSSRKILLCLCLLILAISFMLFVVRSKPEVPTWMTAAKVKDTVVFQQEQDTPKPKKATLPMRDEVDNSGAKPMLAEYRKLFLGKGPAPNDEPVPADPNNPETIRTWWQAAAMVDWYMKAPIRYKCNKRVAMGNWHVCMDEPYTIRPPCLVYSFGINWDFSFDDAMGKLGCEVHSFDPSMHKESHKRNANVTFHDWGLSHENSDSFEARHDVYVKNKQIWKMRTVKRVMKDLGHENRVIDVFKMDIEAYEWAVADNMIETGVFKHIRQFLLEYHIFNVFPPKEEFLNLYKVHHKLRSMGLREFAVHRHTKKVDMNKFNLQSDIETIYSKLRSMGLREFGVAPHPKKVNMKHLNLQSDIEAVNAFISKSEL